MRATVIFAMLSAGTLLAAERMNVSVCNLGGLPESVVGRAEAEAEAVFRSFEVRVEWKGCEDGPTHGQAGSRWFTLRLRNDKPPAKAGDSSLEAMGRAFIGAGHNGYLADAYFQAIQYLAGRHQADADALLGYVITHELGHLLLGPGHVPDGVMRAGWNADELKALRQRWLQFNQSQRARIQHELHTTTRVPATAVQATAK
jgi:hypothetical protein